MNLRVPMTHEIDNSARTRELLDWLMTETGEMGLVLAPVSSDASSRSYYRITTQRGSRIVMDAGVGDANCRQFARVAALLRNAGLNAPAIHAQAFEQGWMLLDDLGTQSFLDVLNEQNAETLFGDATSALIAWQLASKAGVLPDYDDSLLQRELDLWPDWYLARHREVSLSSSQRDTWGAACTLLKRSASTQHQVFVHRDYMPRNLIVSKPNPGIIDFQDAVMGPITYDLVSLFRDAFISWDEQLVDAWVMRYHEQARAFGLPVNADASEFRREFDWMGVQRHLKVIGIFSRLNYRDQKSSYLADIPRFINYLEAVLPQYPELSGLHGLLDETGCYGEKS